MDTIVQIEHIPPTRNITTKRGAIKIAATPTTTPTMDITDRLADIKSGAENKN